MYGGMERNMDLLEPWLAATIEGELSEALRHWKEGTHRVQSADKSQGLSYDDGSNLRIRSAKKGPVVQITKSLTFQDPIWVTLSDSVIRINASISSQASQRYIKEIKRPLTQGTLGMLIQLHDFEILATHFGPRDRRLTLYVKDFKSLDSGGSGTFGVAPQAIESREGTKELLNKLAELRKHEKHVHSAASAVESPMKSQPSTQTSNASNDQDSQAGFATQVPRSVAPTVSKSRPLGSATSVNINTTSSADSAKSSAHPTKVKKGNFSEVTSSPLQQKAAPEIPSVSHKKALLSLLRRNHNRAPPPQERKPDSVRGQSLGQVTATSKPGTGENEKQASQVENPITHDIKDSRSATAAQKRKRQSPETSQRKKLSNEPSLQKMNFDSENLAANDALENKASSELGATEASTVALHSQPSSTLILKYTKPHPPNASLKPPIHSTSNDLSSASAQNHMRNGISPRDVRIPKDQETLLSRADSWLPAEPGQREPSANVPISVLKGLNQKAASLAQGPLKSGKKGEGAVSPTTVIDGSVDSESDVPLSSGQWPASPEREQLPPDSSPASAEHFDHSAHETFNTPLPAPSARKPSNASISCPSIPSEPPSPIPARPSSKEPGSLGMTIPSATSPSVTSSSACEEDHSFACQVPGCDKSFKESAGLNAHVNRHHHSTELLENSKCPLKVRIKSYVSPGDLEHHVERQHDGNSVRASHSGSATPTTPGPPTPITPALRSWSERDEGSGQKIPNIVAKNDLDNVEVLATMPLLLDGRSESLGDNELPRRHSSMESELGGNMSPETPSAPVQPATTNLDGTYVAHETPSSPVPASPTSESDLEMTIPLALSETTDSVTNSAPMHSFPCTASQPQDPFTQVMRTPYGISRPQNETSPASMIISLPLKSKSYPLLPLVSGNIEDDTEFVSASITSGPDTLTTETHDHAQSSETLENPKIRRVAARLTGEVNSHVEMPNKSIAENQQETSKVDLVADIPDNPSPIMTESQRQSLELDPPAMLQEVSIQRPALPDNLFTPDGNPRERLSQLPTSDHPAQFAREVKRKAADTSFFSPGVTKRQKRFKVPSAFTFTERSDVLRDPSEGARQYRQEFLASRRSSETSTPTASPTISLAFSPAATPENSRDPSDRARQLRQELLTSRRNSETSTPATSPRIHLTALTRTIEVECQNGDMGKDVEQSTLQDQPIGTGLDRRKSAEWKEISAVPQSRLDAAALPNGTTSIEVDSNDAKPGAQDNALDDHEADTSVFVVQNADVERTDPMPSLVIKESIYTYSDDETQRARSIELDASIPSPEHRETKGGLTNIENEADQTVTTETGVKSTNWDQSEDMKEGGRPVDLEIAQNYLPTRAEEVAQQETDLRTPRAISDNVPERKNAATEYMQGKSSIEGLTIELPSQTVMEPSTQQPLMVEDAKTQIPREVTIEPTSDRQRIGLDTNTPMADVHVPQDMSSPKSFAQSGEPIDQSTPLPSVVSPLVSDAELKSRPHLSPITLDPISPASNPISDSKIQSIEKHQNSTQLSLKPSKQELPSVAQSLFDRFKATYPMYPGDSKHFGAICRKISQLVKLNRMEHQSLWDDFIIRHKVDYLQYLRQCAEEAEDAVPYEIFYQTQVEGPQYQQRVISRQNLDEALSLFGQQPSPKPVHAETIGAHKPRVQQVDHKSTSRSSPIIEKRHNKSTSARNSESPRLGGNQSASGRKPATSYKNDRRLPDARVVIDLTEDDTPDSPPKGLRDREIAPLSGLLHPVNGVSVEPPSSKRHQDNAGSFFQVPSTSPIMQSSHASPSSQTIRPPLVPTESSTKNATKSLPRPLPWKDPNHNILQSSPIGKASDSSKRRPGSGLREIRPKAVTNTRDDRLQVSIASTPKSLKQRRIIQLKWGIEAQELLELDYCRRQVWSESMLELLAVIASKVNLVEARIRVIEAMDTRIRDNAWRGADHASQERTIQKSDLEVVRGVVATSSMSTTSPFSPPHTNAAVEKQSQGSPIQWWHDNNTPFKSFARAYASIRHGKGNSFARAGSAGSDDTQRVAGARRGGVEPKKIDITRWNL